MAKVIRGDFDVKHHTFHAKIGTSRDTRIARDQSRQLAEAVTRFLNVNAPRDELRMVSLLFAKVLH